jgi:hypothetical protein
LVYFRTVTAVAAVRTFLVATSLCWLAAGCSQDRTSAGPAATVAAGTRSERATTPTTAASTTTTTAAEPARTGVEREVEDAYLRSWDVYADALLRLDASRLEQVYSGPALLTRRDEVAQLAAGNTPVRVRVEHDYEIVVLNADDAFVLEDHVNHSVLLDGQTMQPIEPDPNRVVRREYVLRKGSGGWRVAHVNAGS